MSPWTFTPIGRKLSLAACLLVLFWSWCANAGSGVLDGKVFVGDAGEKGKPADERGDVITFADGTFHSSVCDQWGYNKGVYRTTREGDAITFETETQSKKDGRLVWNGTLKGDQLEGVFTHYRKPRWYRPHPAPVEHWFKAKLKQ